MSESADWDNAPHGHAVGRLGEDAAWSYLQAQGYRLIARNWRAGRQEIDIIAEDPQGVLVFVEVKANRGEGKGAPGERVDGKKRLRVQRVAERFVGEKSWHDREMRFDVITLTSQGGTTSLAHHANAFLPQLSGYLGF